jgi:sporulation protein YhbH
MNTFESPHSFISRRDWSFDRQGEQDQSRHHEKVKDAIKGNLDSIISDGSIITADPQSKKIIKVPMRSLEIPRIKYKDSNEGIGTGDGEVGDQIGSKPGGKGSGNGKEAGQDPGVEYYEAEFTMEEIQEMVFADLGLPNLKVKKKQSIESEVIVFDDVRKQKKPSNLDIMRTIEANMRRNAQEHGKAEIKDISPDDYHRRTWREEVKQDNSAVVIAMADISGSMGDFEKYMTRAFCWWTVNFLKTKYPKVDIAFVVHDTQAEEVDEEKFFSRGSGGGTMCSSANELTLDLIDKRYPPDQYNIYPLHFSDGDNYAPDNAKCVNQINQMLEGQVNQYAYVQVGTPRYSSLRETYDREIKNERFTTVTIAKKEDILNGLKKVFPPDQSA